MVEMVSIDVHLCKDVNGKSDSEENAQFSGFFFLSK